MVRRILTQHDLVQYKTEASTGRYQPPPANVGAAGDAANDDPTEQRAERLRLPLADLANLTPRPDALASLPAPLVRKLRCVPLLLDGGFLVVAMEAPDDAEAWQTLEFVSKHRVLPVVASSLAIRDAIARHYDHVQDAEVLNQLGLGERGLEAANEREMERIAGEMPLVRLVNDVIADAVQRRASDIHVRPGERGTDLLYRIDDELLPVRRFLPSLLPALVSRIKVMGRMNLAEHRVPQDGRTTMVVADGRAVDIRISVLPTVHGESVVLRLLDKSQGLRSMDEIGLQPADRQRLDDALARSHGIFLVTGPTGCGKSTTLYAVLQALRQQRINILTIEDPVEYHLEDVQQMQVNRAAGFTFASAMRNFLRHDPDVIMVGEIRDRETAEIAVEAALTGHLVLSTLHTNTAATAVTRLLDLGVEPYLLRASLLGVMAQRLVRKLCPHCRQPAEPDTHQRDMLEAPVDATYIEASGCRHCEGLGVHGRRAIYELLLVTPGVRSCIVPGAEADHIHQLAVDEGMTSITRAAVAAAVAGEISLAEAFRVRAE
jgi:type IV pilus assembly protein PilB